MRLVDFVGKWSSILTRFYDPKDYTAREQSLSSRSRQARHADIMTIIWWILSPVLLLIASLEIPSLVKVAVIGTLALRIVNITFANLRGDLREGLWDPKAKTIVNFYSIRRRLVLGIMNYGELIVCFAGIYASDPTALMPQIPRPLDWFSPLYFSAITQLAIGYGDLTPAGWARAVSILQGGCGLLLVVMTIGRLSTRLQVSDASHRRRLRLR
ncbi:MAG: potassium channel family protein [Candidatus Zixiibacteriota bacterium]